MIKDNKRFSELLNILHWLTQKGSIIHPLRFLLTDYVKDATSILLYL